MSVDYEKYNNLPWWGYTKIADNFPTFGISAASRNDLINGDVDEPTKKRRASFIIAALIILALVLLLILPAAVAGPGLFAAGGISAIAPIITGGVGLLGAAAYFGIKSYQNAQSLKRNLDLAENRDKIIVANQKYRKLDTDQSKNINDTFTNKHITEARFKIILDKAKKKFVGNARLQKIYVGAQLLKCYTATKITDENSTNDARTQPLKRINIADKFNEFFDLNKDDARIQDKNDALLACVARNHYDKIKVADPDEKRQLAKHIRDARDAFYKSDVSDNVVNIALNNAVGSYYEDIHQNHYFEKFYNKDRGDKFEKADLFDKEIGIQKASILGEALGSALATLPIMTGLYNAHKSRLMSNRIEEAQDSNNQIQKTNNEIDKIFKSYKNYQKIDSDVVGLDSIGNGRVTIDECKAYASSKGIAEQDVYNWMKSYGITPPTSTSSTTVESIVMNKSLGAGFTKYINDNYSGDKSAIDPKVFDTYNSSSTTYDETTKTLTISFGNPANKITLDENQIKRFGASTDTSLTKDKDDKDDFSKAVLAKYKVFATEIKSASIYTITEQDHDDLMKAHGITAPIRGSTTTVQLNVIDPKDFDAYNSTDTKYDEKTKELKILFGSPAKTITLDENQIKRFAASTGKSLTKPILFFFGNDAKQEDKDDFSKAVLEKYKVLATDIQKNVKNPSGWRNYLNGLKKENGFTADSMKVASAEITTINIPADLVKGKDTGYEKFFYNYIPGLCEDLRKLGPGVDKAGVIDLADSLFDSLFGFFPKQSSSFLDFLDKNMIGDGMTVDDFKTYLCGAGPGAIDYLENFSKYMYYSVQPNGAKDAAKCLTNMNALLDKMCNEEPGKSYTEQFWREKFNVSVGDGSATREVEKFKQSVSNWTKTLGNGVKVVNNIPETWKIWTTEFWDRRSGRLSGGDEAKVKTLAYTKANITVNWSESKTVNMLGDNVAPSDDKVGLQKHLQKQSNSVVISDDMKNAAIVGILGGLGAGLVGGVAAYDERKDNKKNNQYLDVVVEEKRKRIETKDDGFDALLKNYDASNNPISNKVNNPKNDAAVSSPKRTNKANDRAAKKPEDLNKMNNPYKRTSDSSSSQGSQASKVKSKRTDKTNLTKEQDNTSNLSRGGIY